LPIKKISLSLFYKHDDMRKLIFIFGLLLLTVSCKKYEGPYTQVPEEVDTTAWQDGYTDGGVLPGGGTQTQNELIGTKWVLIKVVTAFSTTYPYDTINFISNDRYILNQNAQRPYSLSAITGTTNKSLTLNYFYPFGGSHYSGQIGQYAVEDGFMSSITFVNSESNSAPTMAWFQKI